MSQQNIHSLTTQNSPRNSRPNRSKSRMLRQNKPIYLTDGQVSSSDHTNVSCSEISMMRIEYESKMRKLQRQNKQLRQVIVTLKASQYYEVDQQRIKSVIRQNQSLKLTILQLQNDIKLLDQQLQKVMVESQYLKKSNKTLKQQLQQLVKQNVRQKHNYLVNNNINNNTNTNSNHNNNNNNINNNNNQTKTTNTNSSSKKKIYTSSYGDDIYDNNDNSKQQLQQNNKLQSQLSLLSQQHYLEQQKDNNNSKVTFIVQHNKNQINLQKKYKYNQKSIQTERLEYRNNIYQQQSAYQIIEKQTNNKLPIKSRNKSRSNRTSSKSNQKLFINSLIGQKTLNKRPKKQFIDIPSTSQSQNTLKHYKSTSRIRAQIKSRQHYMPTSRSPNPYETGNIQQKDYMRKKTQSNVGGQYNQDYYVVKRDVANKVKKNVYYI